MVFPIIGLRPGLERRLSWYEHLSSHEMIKMMKESGRIDAGSHTVDLHHQQPDGLPAVTRASTETDGEYRARIERDLRAAKDVLELQFDRSITAPAWPYGRSTPTARAIARDLGYTMLFTIDPGHVTPATSPHAIPRFLVPGPLDEFISLLSGVSNHPSL